MPINANLSRRQLKAIPALLTATTLDEGCKLARISRQTFYNWLEDANFKNELARQRSEMVQEGLQNLKSSLKKAVSVLIECLESNDLTVKRRAANDLLSHALRMREVEEIEDRIQKIEEIIIRRKTYA